jgi:hypothetical protein
MDKSGAYTKREKKRSEILAMQVEEKPAAFFGLTRRTRDLYEN